MNTNDEQQEWEKKLSAAGFAVDGIDFTDAAVMMEIYKTLGLNTDNAHDIPVKTRVQSFIKAARKRESFDMKEQMKELTKELVKAQANANEALVKSQVDLQHHVKELVEIMRAEKTDEKAMSKASSQWAKELVDAMNITVEEKEPNKATVLNTEEPPGYDWRVTTAAGETVEIGEHQGTQGARKWFQRHFLSGDELESLGYKCKVVTNHALPPLKAGGKSCTGKGDMVIGKESDMALAFHVYEQVPGLIELKTDEYDIRFGQIILELTAFSRASRFGRGAVLLVSDCNTKWGLAWFQNYNTIWWRRYSSARKCWMDFKEMLLNAGERAESIKPPTRKRRVMLKEEDGNDDDDQNLDGFEDNEPDRKRAAVENEAYLNQLANYLGEMYGERPVVPEWAKAKNIVPDYYA